MAGRARARFAGRRRAPLSLRPAHQRHERSRLSRTFHGPRAILRLRSALGFVGSPIVDAFARPVLDLALAPLRLRDALRDLGCDRLAADLILPGVTQIARWDRGQSQNDRSGARATGNRLHRIRAPFMVVAITRPRFIPTVPSRMGSHGAGAFELTRWAANRPA